MKTFIIFSTIVFIGFAMYAILHAMDVNVVTLQATGLVLTPIVIWFYLKWRKAMRLEETFVGIQFIDD